jgi:Spy/CpxP family protein refolding chaperone
MGQFGFARTALIMMPPVQEELKLTESQKRKIREWLDQGRQRGEEMGRSWREQAQNGELEQPENLPLAARIVQFTTIMNQVSSMLKDNERGLAQILSSGQRKRLDQISLQMEGVSALVRPEVAQALYLTPYQLERIHQILALSRTRQMTTWLEQAFVMGRRPGQRPTETEGGVESRREASASVDAPAPAKPGDPADEKAVRAQREREFRKQFESMRDRTDRIHEEASIAILRVLNKRQRAGFDKLLGEPFDPAQINTFGRPPASSSSANPNPEPNPKP